MLCVLHICWVVHKGVSWREGSMKSLSQITKAIFHGCGLISTNCPLVGRPGGAQKSYVTRVDVLITRHAYRSKMTGC